MLPCQTILHKLDSVHHLGLCLALGAFKSSPVESLHAEYDFLSLYRRRALLSLKYFVKLQQFPTNKLHISASSHAIYFSRPRLSRPFPVRMQALLDTSSLSISQVLPLRPCSFPPWLLPQVSICPLLLPFSKSTSPPLVVRSIFLEHFDTHSDATHVLHSINQSILDRVESKAPLTNYLHL